MFLLRKLIGTQDHDAILNKHFAYQEQIQSSYRNRANPRSLKAAIKACYSQIEMAPQALKAFKSKSYFKKIPSHVGYEQLCIIREKEGNFDEVIRLSAQAKAQGWAGTWDTRIARCLKKQKS